VLREARPTKDAQRQEAPMGERRGATGIGCAAVEDADMPEWRRGELQAVLREARPSKDGQRQRTPMEQRRRCE